MVYDEGLARHLDQGDGLVDAVGHGHPLGTVVGIAGHYDVLAPGQRPAGEGFKGLAAHDDAVACGDGLEVLEVGRQVAQELPVSADCTVGVDGYDSR